MLAAHLEWGGNKKGARNFDLLRETLFPYKFDNDEPVPDEDCHRKEAMSCWTSQELARYNAGARESSYWHLDWRTKAVTSVKCSGTGPLRRGHYICDACESLTKMSTFQRSLRKACIWKIRRRDHDADEKMRPDDLAIEKKRKLDTTRASYLQGAAISVRENHKRPGIVAISNVLENPENSDTRVFQKLVDLSQQGAFKEEKTILSLLKTLADYTERRQGGPNAMKGPSARTIQRAVADRAMGFSTIGALDVSRLDQYLQELKDKGLADVPLVVMADATKLPDDTKGPAVSFTTAMASGDNTGHIVGSTLPMERTAVRLNDDVDSIWLDIKQSGGTASQVLAVMVGAPLDGISPKVVAFHPTDGKDKGEGVKAILDELRKAIQERGHRVLSYALDGGSAEKGAQRISQKERTDQYLTLAAPESNIELKAPVVDGTPLIMVQDVEHGRKTLRNNLTSGARLMNLERRWCVTSIVKSDLMFHDKQDDGAALRLFCEQALESLVVRGKIREGMEGLFSVLSVFGELFDAWLNREIPHDQRSRMVWRAFFFLRAWKQDIHRLNEKHPLFIHQKDSYLATGALETMEWLASSLLLLIEAHVNHFPNVPLQPWNHSTRSLEHWFGQARRLLHSDFTMAELLEGCRSQDVRLQIYHTGDPKLVPKAISSRKVGYQFDNERLEGDDHDTWNRLRDWPSDKARTEIIPALAYHEACSYLHMLKMPEPSKDLSEVQLRQRHAQLLAEAETDPKSEESDASEVEEPARPQQKGKEYNATMRMQTWACRQFDLSNKKPVVITRHSMSLSHLVAAPSAVGHWGSNVLDPMKAVKSRRQTGAKHRLHSEKSKKTTTVQVDKDSVANLQYVGNRVRGHREAGNESAARTARTRTKSHRERRWESSVKSLKKALPNTLDIYQIPALDARGVTKDNPIKVDSLIIARPAWPANTKQGRHVWYLAKVLGVFGRSGAKYGVHSWSPEFQSTEELSTMDLMVFTSLDHVGKLFDHGVDRLHYTHAREIELVHHFGPVSEHLAKVQSDGDVWYKLLPAASAVWKSLATDAVGNAIEAGMQSFREAERKKKGAAKKKSPAEGSQSSQKAHSKGRGVTRPNQAVVGSRKGKEKEIAPNDVLFVVDSSGGEDE
ncbi:hypothetical protein QFC20_003958 [Naganishia adeliensis]|uniref:Uncharacterized protein n=1 Tax=Naganishia adeliensis TaxID=92952 RepID=A0ACC2W6L6_9TREE|nr:hypothetical protein QFC20_003958 [Naganishia adeliensis]